MYDYISRNAVFDWFCESADIDGCVDLPKNNGSCKKGCRHCIDGKELDEIPTADVRENVHAHWEIVYDEDCDSGGKYICGNCRHAFSFGAYFELCRFDYCPNCGAQMDERREE